MGVTRAVGLAALGNLGNARRPRNNAAGGSVAAAVPRGLRGRWAAPRGRRWRLDLSPRSDVGREKWPQAAIHLIANWLLPSAAEFDNQLI
jgi:hypothetical protein